MIVNKRKEKLYKLCFDGMTEVRKFCHDVESDRNIIIEMINELQRIFEVRKPMKKYHFCKKCTIEILSDQDWINHNFICKKCKKEADSILKELWLHKTLAINRERQIWSMGEHSCSVEQCTKQKCETEGCGATLGRKAVHSGIHFCSLCRSGAKRKQPSKTLVLKAAG